MLKVMQLRMAVIFIVASSSTLSCACGEAAVQGFSFGLRPKHRTGDGPRDVAAMYFDR